MTCNYIIQCISEAQVVYTEQNNNYSTITKLRNTIKFTLAQCECNELKEGDLSNGRTQNDRKCCADRVV